MLWVPTQPHHAHEKSLPIPAPDFRPRHRHAFRSPAGRCSRIACRFNRVVDDLLHPRSRPHRWTSNRTEKPQRLLPTGFGALVIGTVKFWWIALWLLVTAALAFWCAELISPLSPLTSVNTPFVAGPFPAAINRLAWRLGCDNRSRGMCFRSTFQPPLITKFRWTQRRLHRRMHSSRGVDFCSDVCCCRQCNGVKRWRLLGMGGFHDISLGRFRPCQFVPGVFP